MHPSTAPDAQTKNKKPRGYVGVMTVADLKRTLGNARGMMPTCDAAKPKSHAEQFLSQPTLWSERAHLRGGAYASLDCA